MTNYLAPHDPSFANGLTTTGSTPNCDEEFRTDGGYDGQNYTRLTCTGGTANFITAWVPYTANTAVSARVGQRGVNGLTKNGRCDIQFGDSLGAVLGTNNGTNTALTSSWAGATNLNRSHATAEQVRIRYTLVSSALNDQVDVDAFQIETGTTLPAFNPTEGSGTATIASVWMGNFGTDKMTLVTKLTNGGSNQVKIRYSVNSNMSGSVDSSPVTPDAQGVSKHTLTGLSANTTYYYRVVSGSTEVAGSHSFKTMPSSGSYSFGFASCRNNNNDSVAFTDVLTRNSGDARFFLQIGDIHYDDIGTEDAPARRAGYDNFLNQTQINAALRTLPMDHMWDDHDSVGNGSYSGMTGWTTAASVYRERVPHFPLPQSNSVEHTFVVGRVRYIVMDCRRHSDLPGAAEAPTKTRLGATQKAWLLDLLQNSTEPLIFLISTPVWIANVGDGDTWGAFSHERTEIANAIAANGRVVILSGDQHVLAIDDGTNSPGGCPVWHAAALARVPTYKGGPYSGGQYPPSAAGLEQQYGFVEINDTGSSISATFRGIKTDGTVWQSATFTPPAALSPVSTTRSSAWGIRSSVAATRSSVWNIYRNVLKQEIARWNVAQRISTTRTNTWSVLSRVSTTRSNTWNVQGRVTATRANTWAVRTRVTTTRSNNWNVIAKVATTRASAWAVRSRVAPATRATTWTVRTNIATTRITNWSVRSKVSTTRATTWTVRTSVSTSRATNWAARATTTATRVNTWNVRSKITPATRSTTWGVRSKVSTTRANTWGVRSKVLATRTSNWTVHTKIATTRATTWNIRSKVSATRSNTWTVRSTVAAASRSTNWSVRTSLATTRATGWSVRSTVLVTRANTWNARQNIAASRTATWNIGDKPVINRHTTWAINARVSTTRSASWTVLSRVAPATRSTSWTVRTSVVANRASSWIVRTSVVATRAATWIVRTSVSITRTNNWNVRAKVFTKTYENWVSNPSFETDTNNGWSAVRGTLTDDTSWAEFGTRSRKMTCTTDTSSNFYCYARRTTGPLPSRIAWVNPGDYVSARITVKALRDLRVNPQIIGYTVTGGGAVTSMQNANPHGYTNMVAGEVRTFDVINALNPIGSDIMSIGLFVYFRDPATSTTTLGDYALIDGGVVINHGTTPTDWTKVPYWDGSRIGSWSGSQHNSDSVRDQLATWNVLQNVATTRVTNWNAAERVVVSRNATWGIGGRVNAPRTANWGVRTRIATSRSTGWNVRSRVSTPRMASWAVRSRLTASRTASWQVRERVFKRLGARTYPSYILATAPEAHWEFDELSGTLVDDSANNHDATLLAGVTPGRQPLSESRGKSAYFDGNSTSYATTAQNWSSLIQGAGIALTVAAWVNIDATGQNTHYNLLGINQSNTVRMGIVARRNVVNNRLAIWSNTTGWWESSQTIPPGVPTHVAVTFNGRVVSFYINGVLTNTQTTNADFPTGLTDVAIGKPHPNVGEQFRGNIDGLSLWNRVLTPAEVANVADPRSATWNVRTKVTTTRNTIWNTRSTVLRSRTTNWGVRTRVTATRASSWSVTGSASSFRSTTWDVAGPIYAVSTSRSTSWNVIGPTGTTRTTNWTVKSRVVRTRTTNWGVRQRVQAPRTTDWGVLSTSSSIRSTGWVVKRTVTQEKATEWGARANTGSQIGTAWNVDEKVTTTRLTDWAALETVTEHVATEWVANAYDLDYRAWWYDGETETEVALTYWDGVAERRIMSIERVGQ